MGKVKVDLPDTPSGTPVYVDSPVFAVVNNGASVNVTLTTEEAEVVNASSGLTYSGQMSGGGEE